MSYFEMLCILIVHKYLYIYIYNSCMHACCRQVQNMQRLLHGCPKGHRTVPRLQGAL